MQTTNNCEKCKYSYTKTTKTDPCSKCGGNTSIIKLPESEFYKYAEECSKCKHLCYLGISLAMNMETDYSAIPAYEEVDGVLKVKEPKGLCALCS